MLATKHLPTEVKIVLNVPRGCTEGGGGCAEGGGGNFVPRSRASSSFRGTNSIPYPCLQSNVAVAGIIRQRTTTMSVSHPSSRSEKSDELTFLRVKNQILPTNRNALSPATLHSTTLKYTFAVSAFFCVGSPLLLLNTWMLPVCSTSVHRPRLVKIHAMTMPQRTLA